MLESVVPGMGREWDTGGERIGISRFRLDADQMYEA